MDTSSTPDSPEAMLALLERSVLTSGFSTMLGARPLRCWQGECELLIDLKPELTQHHGFAHGAVVGAAADNACAWAAASVAGDVVTASYTLHLVAPAKGERLRAKGLVLKSGRRQLTVRADVFAETGNEARLVATALAAVARVER
ncbi:hotdog fold thioesterase [Oleomonas cavernae]|uniref:Hotdog fold thioesterase n=1 Tax=Oleomonas cavernae TaxID=2320859 RepID=A0A418WC55_9PROT|nr:hotdog domain-containing protein [Oleomonas cavernae]RJF87592.1 hotdog fold thioesterase [Oleomonas cavernae]